MTRWILLLGLACAACASDPNYVLTISAPDPGSTSIGTNVSMSAQGENLGDGDALTATVDDMAVVGFHTGFTPGHCHYCFFSVGFDVPPAITDGEHVVHLVATKGSKELASDDISLIFDVPLPSRNIDELDPRAASPGRIANRCGGDVVDLRASVRGV